MRQCLQKNVIATCLIGTDRSLNFRILTIFAHFETNPNLTISKANSLTKDFTRVSFNKQFFLRFSGQNILHRLFLHNWVLNLVIFNINNLHLTQVNFKIGRFLGTHFLNNQIHQVSSKIGMILKKYYLL